ncbi:hypothetical protein GCM10027185_51710 [Spirosoma pulveris]
MFVIDSCKQLNQSIEPGVTRASEGVFLALNWTELCCRVPENETSSRNKNNPYHVKTLPKTGNSRTAIE